MRKLNLVFFFLTTCSNILLASEPSIHFSPNPKNVIEISFDLTVPADQGAFAFKKLGVGFFVLPIFEDGMIIESKRWLKNPAGKGEEGNFPHFGDAPYNTRLGSGIYLFPRMYSDFKFERNGNYYFMCFIKKARNLKDGVKYSNILCVEIQNEKVISSKIIATRAGLPTKVQESFEIKLNEIAQFENGSLNDFSWE